MQISDICRQIEQFAPLSFQEPYDNAGLIIGDPAAEVSGVLICLDVSEAVIDEAIALGYNMIVAHHPLIFKGLKQLTGKNAIERCVIKAIRHQIAIYAGHTNVDSVINGVSAKMCEKLGLQETSILVPKEEALVKSVTCVQTENADAQAGLGMIGILPQPMDESDFLQAVKKAFQCQMLRYSGSLCKKVQCSEQQEGTVRTKTNEARKIQKVAVCGGSGSEFTALAVAMGADAYVTADVKYHDFQAAASDILLIDAGHYETEQYTKEIFFDLLSKNISTFAVQISKREKNPVKYI